MSTDRAYGTPAAFRRALTDRLRGIAASSRWELAQLQRQFAYDRLLERLYAVDDGWVVKGAVALIARDLAVRETVDVDVHRDASREVIEADIRRAASEDIGDWFRFDVGPARAVADQAQGIRFRITAYIGDSIWAEFNLDIVGSGTRMTGAVEDVPALAGVTIPDVEQHGYWAYPLVDHIADKVAAMAERYGKGRYPSTRYKDLVDLVAIVRGATVDAEAMKTALTSEAERRRIALPAPFEIPDRSMWEIGYGWEARRSLLPVARTLQEALSLLGSFVDPIIDGSAGGVWDPKAQKWVA
jgi:hypothetical protein